MKRIDKKLPFKVPDGYFTHFNQKLAKQIISTLTSQQISRGAQKELLEYISRESIDGDPVVGKK